MADRDQILAEFQTITGNEDIAECIAILEQHDWNLMEAVQMALASSDAEPMSGSTFVNSLPSFDQLPQTGRSGSSFEQAVVGESLESLNVQCHNTMDMPPSEAAASSVEPEVSFQSFTGFSNQSSVRRPRMLNFKIEYQDRIIELNVFDNEKVGKLKELLEKEIGIPASKLNLCGWVSKHDRKVDDEDVLVDLKLPSENTLFLQTTEVNTSSCVKPKNGEDTNLFERLSQMFTLNIHFKDKDKRYSLKYPGSKTVQEVKGDVYSLIDVPVSRQVWCGWPDTMDDDKMTLAGSGIGFPCHSLEVSAAKTYSRPVRTVTRSLEDKDQSQSDDDIEMDSEDDFEDAQDHFSLEDHFLESEMTGPRKPEPLMPENAVNETEALECFSKEFASRFGDCHPVFYIGSLESALNDALQCRARDRKLLAIYLHHDGSILSNVFCSQVLCAESVVTFLSNNFIIWAWDLTSESNRARLLSMCTQHFGSLAASKVRNIKPDELPLLLIISRNRGTNEVVNAIRGNTTADDMLFNLIHAHESFREQLLAEIQEEEEREARERVKQEQDRAYQESLEADRAKSEAKRLEDEANRRREEDERLRQQQEEEQRRQEAATKEAVRQSIANQLPAEPPPDCKEPCTMIRVRCPEGRNLVRRFLASDPLQTLLNYIISEGYHITDYKVLATFPRRDLTQLNASESLQALKLVPQETVILEEK